MGKSHKKSFIIHSNLHGIRLVVKNQPCICECETLWSCFQEKSDLDYTDLSTPKAQGHAGGGVPFI